MDIVFLDQNKWIELAGVKAKKEKPALLVQLYEELIDAVNSGIAIFPLTESHILETSKRNDLVSRRHVALAQAELSKGYVFRSRKARLQVEIRLALAKLFNEEPIRLPKDWIIASGFMQAFEPYDEMLTSDSDDCASTLINSYIDPAILYLSYMLEQDDNSRRKAHEAFTAGSISLLENIEERRALLTGESIDLRTRAYSARLFLDHQGYIIDELRIQGRTIDDMKAKGAEAIVGFLKNVPTLYTEAELAARLEGQPGRLKENDIRDMASFCTVLPYADIVVGEKVFIALATQAKLGQKYGTVLSRSLESLIGSYARPTNVAL